MELQYEIVELLGKVTFLLAGLAAGMFFIRRFNKYLLKKKGSQPWVQQLQKALSKTLPYIVKFHRPIGISAVVTGIFHGYFILGGISLHSGYLAWGSILLLGITGIARKLVKQIRIKIYLAKVHTVLMFLMVGFVFLHVFVL